MKNPPEILPIPELFRDDFEFGSVPLSAHIRKDKKLGKLEVVKTAFAKSGSRALRMADAPGQTQSYFPMLTLSPRFMEGSIRCAFAIRIEANSDFQHEWRDSNTPYHTGPSFRIRNGKLQTPHRKLIDLPFNKWIELVVTAPLGGKAGEWTLSVTLPGSEPRRFENLPIRSKDWKKLEWIGFISQADVESEIWIDDLELSR